MNKIAKIQKLIRERVTLVEKDVEKLTGRSYLSTFMVLKHDDKVIEYCISLHEKPRNCYDVVDEDTINADDLIINNIDHNEKLLRLFPNFITHFKTFSFEKHFGLWEKITINPCKFSKDDIDYIPNVFSFLISIDLVSK